MRKGILASALLAISAIAQAQDWPNWRGPNFNGSTVQTGLPVHFSKTDGVKWSAPLPGPGASTPIVSGNSVFLTSVDAKAQTLLALCLDRQTGKVKWQQSVGTGYQAAGEGNKIQMDDRSNYASPSPVTDGKRVIFFFGNGDLIAFNHSGTKLWSKNLQKDYGDFCFQWTFSSSPVLFAGKLYVQILQRNTSVSGKGKNGSDSFLLAMDPETGKELWRYSRPTSAVNESRESYSTPIPIRYQGKDQLVISGGDFLSGHDPANGKELWRWGTWNPEHRENWWRLVPSPVVSEGIALICAPKRAPVYAAKFGGGSNASLAWKSDERSPVTSDVPTPLAYLGKFYVVSDVRKAISCVEPATGHVNWTQPLSQYQMVWASPTGGDGKIYLMSVAGEVIVLDAATGKTLSTANLGDGENDIRSTIAVAHGCLFIRTDNRMYCVGK